MVIKLVRAGLAPSLAAAAFVLSAPLALAAAPYDGTWVIDLPASTVIAGTSDSACPALRFPVQIKDGRVTAMLSQVPSRDGGIIVEQSHGPDASPVTGTVGADGAVDAQWQNYHATGQLAGNGGEVTVNGECGPRTAEAYRVSQ